MIVYFNGKFIEKEQVSISPDDRGFVFADGVYEVMRWYSDYFLGLEAHKKRLCKSLTEVRIDWPDGNRLELIANELIRFNALKNQDALFYLQVTRGAAKRNHVFPIPPVPPTIYATVTAFSPFNQGWEEGIAVITMPDERWQRCDIKSIALLPNVLAKQKASETGSMEALFIRNGVLTEGSHSNVFGVKNGIVYTHPESGAILSGISRAITLACCNTLRVPVKEIPVDETSIHNLDELFITNTSGELIPVVRIDGKPIGHGKPGPVTQMLQASFRQFAEKQHS